MNAPNLVGIVFSKKGNITPKIGTDKLTPRIWCKFCYFSMFCAGHTTLRDGIPQTYDLNGYTRNRYHIATYGHLLLA